MEAAHVILRIEFVLSFAIGAVALRRCCAFTKSAKMSWILVIAIGAFEPIYLPLGVDGWRVLPDRVGVTG